MKAKKHIEFDRVFAYLIEGKTDILWFESEEVMRRVGECLVELERTHGNVQEDGAVYDESIHPVRHMGIGFNLYALPKNNFYKREADADSW